MHPISHSISTPDSPERQFWSWFEAHAEELAEADQGTPALAELRHRLRRVDAGLTYELGVGISPCELVISADGIAGTFPAVLRLVAAAPELRNWRIIAFRQRSAVVPSIRFGDLDLDTDGIWFLAVPEAPRDNEEERVSLTLCVRGLTPENETSIAGATFILLDHALGEYDVVTRIGQISWEPLPPDPGSLGLQPFRDLPQAIDAFFKEMPRA
ncbi:MAG: hypothetical protein ACK47B_05385 [Armatimonadota bacterium]